LGLLFVLVCSQNIPKPKCLIGLLLNQRLGLQLVSIGSLFTCCSHVGSIASKMIYEPDIRSGQSHNDSVPHALAGRTFDAHGGEALQGFMEAALGKFSQSDF
jgi:hypothetical protein